MLKHFLNWFLQILIPYLLLVTGFLVIKAGRGQDIFGKSFDIGFDACILGFGIAAVLLGGPDFQAILKDNAATIPLVIGFASIGLFYRLNQSSYGEVAKAWMSVLAASFVFGANTAMVTWLNEARVTPTIVWGIVAWIVPCFIFWLITR